jgi:hypothetical protein
LLKLRLTGAVEISVFQRLVEENGTKPFKLASRPTLMAAQPPFWVEPVTGKRNARASVIGYCPRTRAATTVKSPSSEANLP